MVTSTIKMTAKQYLKLGEDPPGVRLELVDGEIAVSARPTLDHAYTVLELASTLKLHVKRHKLGLIFCDVDTIISEFDVRVPDVLFVNKAKVPRLKRKAIDLVPDLCVEVVSPTSIEVDRQDKFKQYRDAGIAYYWIVDTDQKTFEAFQLKRKKYSLIVSGHGSDVVSAPPFPDLQIHLSELWLQQNS